MKIGEINSFLPNLKSTEKTNSKSGVDFGNVLEDFVKQVNQEQSDSKAITKDFIEGKGPEIHEVMIAGEKAKTSFELLMQIRNKSVEMYKELTRLQ